VRGSELPEIIINNSNEGDTSNNSGSKKGSVARLPPILPKIKSNESLLEIRKILRKQP